MLSSYLFLLLLIKIDLIVLAVRGNSWILWGNPSRELSKCNFSVGILIYSPQYGIDISLFEVFLEFGEELSQRFEVNVTVSLLVNDREGCNSAEINLPLQGLLFLFYLEVIVHFPRDDELYFNERGITFRIILKARIQRALADSGLC